MTSIIDFYLQHAARAVQTYGPRTIVLCEVGTFYEVYDRVPPEESPYLRCCRDLLGLVVTHKGRADDPHRPYMAGIPTVNVRRYNKVLLQQNYTIVFVEQIKPSAPTTTPCLLANGREGLEGAASAAAPPKARGGTGDAVGNARASATLLREITRVLSPGCNLSEDVHESADVGHSVLVSVLVEEEGNESPAGVGSEQRGERALDTYAHIATFDTNRGHTHIETVHVHEATAPVAATLATPFSLDATLERLHEILQTYTFHELCLHTRSRSASFREACDGFARTWRAAGKLVHVEDVTPKAHVFQQTFQAQFLERVYPHECSAFHSVWACLGLQYTDRSCVAVLVLLLEWVRRHDRRLVEALAPPTSHMPSVVHAPNAQEASVEQTDHGGASPCQSHVRCFNDLYPKLNLFSEASTAHASVFHVLNKTRTKMGERLLRERLTRIITSAEEMRRRWDLVACLHPTEPSSKPSHHVCDAHLRGIIDLERVYRRLTLGQLQPYEIPRIIEAQSRLSHVVDHLLSLPTDHVLRALLPDDAFPSRVHCCQAAFHDIFDPEACTHTHLQTLQTSIFRPGRFPEVDAAVAAHTKLLGLVDELAEALMACVPDMVAKRGAGKGRVGRKGTSKPSKKRPTNSSPPPPSPPTPSWITVRHSEKDGYWLELTRTRCHRLEAALTPTLKAWNLVMDHRKTVSKITCNRLQLLSAELQRTQETLVDSVRTTYAGVQVQLHADHYAATVAPLVALTAELDVAFTTATVARANGYVRPTVESESDAGAHLHATGLRHPLIERLLVAQRAKAEYVPNDVRLSASECWLLHGVNSVGKSSLLKSIALAIIMAQAGLFVSAATMTFSPFTKIFARTGNDDNLHRAHSSFVKEMTETAQIVHHADARSLVIADELCASTELHSAVRIVGALLRLLTTRRSVYAFATHLFALQELPVVQQLVDPSQLGVLRNVHLKVDFVGDKLVFERVLRPGLPHNRAYGAMVADKVIRHPVFTELLEAVADTNNTDHTRHPPSSARSAVKPGATSSRPPPILVRPSRYNSGLWTDECAVCGYAPQSSRDIPLETHHICEQQTADPDTQLIDRRFHKNSRHNLVVLCKPCHQDIDRGTLRVWGYRETSEGTELVWDRPTHDEATRAC